MEAFRASFEFSSCALIRSLMLLSSRRKRLAEWALFWSRMLRFLSFMLLLSIM